MNILDKIVLSTIERVETEKNNKPLSAMPLEKKPDNMTFPFEYALLKQKMSFICEIKKASPSKGLITEQFNYIEIAREYERAGADAISVLTEPEYFMGNIEYLAEIRKVVKTPLLRKDFIVDEYQLVQSKYYGADAVLLICSVLTQNQLNEYIKKCDEIGLSSLVECHDEDQIDIALQSGARIIGVNNRDLKTFKVDMGNSLRLRGLVPSEMLFVSESGIKTAEDIKLLYENGVNAVLIGETLMRASNKPEVLSVLKGE